MDDWPLSRDNIEPSSDWGILSHGGWKGVFLVVVAIAWWITGLDGKLSKDVAEVILDVTWVLDSMVKALKLDQNRGHREAPTSDQPLKRKAAPAFDAPASEPKAKKKKAGRT